MTNQPAYCMVSIAPIRSDKKDASEQVSQLVFGEPVTIISVESPWCKILTLFDNYEGYVDEKHLRFLTNKELKRWLDGIHFSPDFSTTIHTPWGKQQLPIGSFVPWGNPVSFSIGNDQFEREALSSHNKFDSPVEAALSLINVPYQWGGKSSCGIDCSGLIQLIFRFFDINLPRDAYQQAEFGSTIAFEDRKRGDVAFFANIAGKITHVGILESKESIIHASGRVRIDHFNEKGILNCDNDALTHQLTYIKRMK